MEAIPLMIKSDLPPQHVKPDMPLEQNSQIQVEYIVGSDARVRHLSVRSSDSPMIMCSWASSVSCGKKASMQNTPAAAASRLECPFWRKVFQEAFGGFEEARKIAPKALLGEIGRLSVKMKELGKVLTFPEPGSEVRTSFVVFRHSMRPSQKSLRCAYHRR